MKKLHSLALYALVTPVITLSAGSLLAQQSTSQGFNPDEQSETQHEQSSAQEQRDAQSTGRDSDLGQRDSQQQPGATRSIGQDSDRDDQSSRPGAARSGPTVTQDDDDQRSQRAGQDGQQTAAEQMDRMRDQDRDDNRGYLERAPNNGRQLSDIMGASVKTSNDEDVGSVDDLIIDDDGQVVAIVVGVGGFLGMGQKDVAIGWGHVSTSGTADDDQELRIDVSRQDLRSAPEFQKRED